MLVASHHSGSTDLLYQFTKEDPNLKTLVTVTALWPIYRISLKSSNRSFPLPLNQSFPNVQQQGFQKDLGCLNASFNLHETLYLNLVYMYKGFLDTSI